LIVILNDNEMSISPNIGAIHRYLTKLTTSRLYRAFERDVWELLGKLPRGGQRGQLAAHRLKEGLQNMVGAGRAVRGDGPEVLRTHRWAQTCRCSRRRSPTSSASSSRCCCTS
jgi:hypothetical protein